MSLAVGQSHPPLIHLKQEARPITLSRTGQSAGTASVMDRLQQAQVVGLGEATHGSHEFFLLKAEIIKRLVEQDDCRVIAFESGFIQSLGMTRFVAGMNQDPAEALKDQGFWPWQTKEVKDLLVWLREWNLKRPSKDRVQLVGVDVQEYTIALHRLSRLFKQAGSRKLASDEMALLKLRDREPDRGVRAVIQEAKDCEAGLSRLLGPEAPLLLDILRESLPLYTRQSALISMEEDLIDRRPEPGKLAAAQRAAMSLLNRSDDLSPALRQSLLILTEEDLPADPDQLSKAVKELESRGEKGLAEVLSFFLGVVTLQKENRFTDRDGAMARLILWLNSRLPKVKLAVWAHNSHIMSFSSPAPKLLKTMGAALKESLGEKYHRLGFSFSGGQSRAISPDGLLLVQKVVEAKPDSWEAAFSLAGMDCFFLPFDTKSPPLKNWLESARPARQFGAVYSQANDESYWNTARLGDLFDSVLYVRTITPSQELD